MTKEKDSYRIARKERPEPDNETIERIIGKYSKDLRDAPPWALRVLKQIGSLETRISRIENGLYMAAETMYKTLGPRKAAFIWGHKPYDPNDFLVLLDHIDAALRHGFIVKVFGSCETKARLEANGYFDICECDCTKELLMMKCFNHSNDSFLAGDNDGIWLMIDDHSNDLNGPVEFDLSGSGDHRYALSLSDVYGWSVDPPCQVGIEIRGSRSGLAISGLENEERCVMSSMKEDEYIIPGGFDQFNIAPWVDELLDRGFDLRTVWKLAYLGETNRLKNMGYPLHPDISPICVNTQGC